MRHVLKKSKYDVVHYTQHDNLSITSLVTIMHSLLLCRGRTICVPANAHTHDLYIFNWHPQKRCVQGRPRIFRFHLRLWCITGRSPPNISNTSTSSAYICRDPFRPSCTVGAATGPPFSPAQDQALALVFQ